MSDAVVIIAPELSPATGGVGDYTLRMLENWPSSVETKILVAEENPSAVPYRVAALGQSRAAIETQLSKNTDRVLVQYSAYGFDRHGYPGKLIRALVNWKQATGGRLVVMFHEIWTFWPMTNKNYFVQLLHKRALRHLLQRADAVFTSTESQAEHLRILAPARPVQVLPVGANVRRVEDINRSRRHGWAVLFGRQATRRRALEKMHASLVSLADAGVLTRIITVGAGGDRAGDESERALLAGLHLREGFEQRGRQTEREISEILLTASFGLFGQEELSLSKSGTFMAYAAHELNVIADFANRSKSEPTCWLVGPRELIDGEADPALPTRATALASWQQRVSSWRRISENFIKALELKSWSGAGATSI